MADLQNIEQRSFEVLFNSFERKLPLKIGAVISLYRQFKKDCIVAEFIINILNQDGKDVPRNFKSVLSRKLHHVNQKYKSYKCRYTFWDEIVKYSNQPFEFTLNVSPVPHLPSPVVGQTEGVSLRNVCQQCKHYQKSLKKYVKKCVRLRRLCKNSKYLCMAKLNRNVKRKDAIIRTLRTKKRHLEVQLKRVQRQNIPKPLMSVNDKRKISSLETQVKNNIRDNRGLTKDVSQLLLTIDDLECRHSIKDEIETKENGKYTFNVRKTVFNMLCHNVPVAHISLILTSISKNICQKQLTSVPTTSTCAQMAYEMTVLTYLQTAEAMLKEKDLTIGIDGTTVLGQHMSEFHVTTADKCYLLSVVELAGGLAEDYTDHVCQAIELVVETYCDCYNQDYADTTSKVIKSLTNFISDRAPVNGKVVRLLKERLDIVLTEYKCNLHPLDSFANKCREALKKYDVEVGNKSATFGNACGTANIVYGVSKMRYRDGRGDPRGFINMLQENKIPNKAFTRYVGNRLHVLFYLCNSICKYRQPMLSFFNGSCSSQALGSALACDLSNLQFFAQMKVLALIGVIVTAPWMREFYANAKQHSHLEMVPYIKKAVTTLEFFSKNPEHALSTELDVFGQPLTIQTELKPESPEENDLIIKLLQVLFQAILKVTTDQMGAYIDGTLSNPTKKMIEKSKSTPVNNIHAERILGMADHHIRRCPNATIGFIDGKTKYVYNKTQDWIERMGESEQKHVIQFAITKGAKLRKKTNDLKELLEKTIALRRKRIESDIGKKRKKEKEREILKALENKDIHNKLFDDIAQTLVLSFLQPELLFGKLFIQAWEGNDGITESYYGKVIDQKIKYKKIKLIISYWSVNEENEEQSEDFDIPIEQFVYDICMKELKFIDI